MPIFPSRPSSRPDHRKDPSAAFLAVASRWPSRLAGALLLSMAACFAHAQPQAVGLTRLTLDGVPVTLVYPSSAPTQAWRRGSFELQVAPEGAPAAGTRRLVVLSHGTGGSDMADHAMAATLARAGLIVAQPLHAGDNFSDSSRAGPAAWQTRPQEVLKLINALAAHPDWGQRLALDRVGVHGMSAGGMTALTLAGGRWRLLDLVRHCLAHGDDDAGFCFNGAIDAPAREARRARFEGLRGAPEDALPAELVQEHGGLPGDGDPRLDARIASVTVAVPVAAPLSAASLVRIRVPVGVISAGRDTLLLPAWHSQHVLRECRACRTVAVLPGAGHFDLLAPWPADLASRTAMQQVRGGSPEPGFDPAERQRAFDAIAAFHLEHLQPGKQPPN